MTRAELERIPFRRYGRARIIRTETRAPTEPIVFVLPPRDELKQMWAEREAYLERIGAIG